MKRIILPGGIFLVFLFVLAVNVVAQEVYVSPSSSVVALNDAFKINVMVSGPNVTGVDFKLSFDNTILDAKNMVLGQFLTDCAGCSLLTIPSQPVDGINNNAGEIKLSSAFVSGYASGTGPVVIITFEAKYPGISQFDLHDVTLTDGKFNPIDGVTITDGSATVLTQDAATNVTNITDATDMKNNTTVQPNAGADKTTIEGKTPSNSATPSEGFINASQSPSKNATYDKIEAKNETDKATKENASISEAYTESEPSKNTTSAKIEAKNETDKATKENASISEAYTASENTNKSGDNFPLSLLLLATLIIISILILLIIQRRYFK